MCDDNGKPLIDTIYNILLAPDSCVQIFSIITLMNLKHTCHFHKGFCMIFFGCNSQNRRHYRIVHIKTFISDKTKENSKSQELTPKKRVSLELLNQRL